MANTKISALTALTGANVAPATDILPIVDLSAAETKKITVAELLIGMGVTASAAELNILDGVTRTATQLNYVDATSSIQTQLDAKLASSTAASTYLTIANAASTYFTIANASTANIAEGSNLYFTEARVLGTDLAGLSITGGAITSGDLVLSAFGKLQNQINAVLGGAAYQGVWNATTNSPSLSSGVGTQGYYYVVSVAGSTNLDGITDWKVGDWAIYNGTTWDKVDNTDAVSSVDGMIGAVSLSATYQAKSANLTTYAGIAPSANVQTLLGAANYSAFRTSLGVAIGSDVQAYNSTLAAVAGGTYTGASSITTLGTVTTGTLSTGAVIGGVTMTLGTDATGDIYYRNSGGVLTRLAIGTSGQVLTVAAGLPSWATGGGGSGDMTKAAYDPANINEQLVGLTATQTLSNKTLTTPKIVSGGSIIDGNGNKYLQFSETASAVNYFTIYNTATTASPFLMAEGSDTNISIRFRVKGTGALVADSTASTGGTFPRGTRAVDLQLEKTSAGQIASGTNSFAVGINNTASNTAAVSMGSGCTSSGTYTFSVGQNNVASGQASFCGGGDNNNATGINSAAFGTTCTASATYAIVMGRRASGYLQGQFANSNGFFAATGDSQHSFFVARHTASGITTGLTTNQLFLDGTSVAIVPNGTNRFWRVEVSWVSVVTAISGTATGVTVGDVISSTDTFTMKKLASTVTIVGTPTRDAHSDTSMSTATMVYSGSTVNLELKLTAPTFAGGGSLTLRTTATLHLTEVAY